MAADPAALEPNKGSGTAIQLVSEISNKLLKFQLPPTCQLALADKIARLRLILAAGPATASPTVPDATDRPISRPAGPREALPLSSDKLDQATRLNASGPPTPGTQVDLGGTESASMGGRRNAAALQPTLDTPAIAHQQQQHSADLPPREGAEASSSLSHSAEPEWVQVGFQKLTKAFKSLACRLSERLDVIESKNPFAALENNADTPSCPAPVSYASAAAEPAPPPRNLPAARAAPSPRSAASREVVVLKVASLPETHPLRSFPPNRLLSAARLFLQSWLPPTSLVYACRLEHGDVQLVASNASRAALLRRAIPMALPDVAVATLPEKLSAVLLGVPVDARVADIEAVIEGWCCEAQELAKGEEVVKEVRRAPVLEGARYCTWFVELWNTSRLNDLVSIGLRQVFKDERDVWVQIVRARSRDEQRAWREKRGTRRGAVEAQVEAQEGSFPELPSRLTTSTIGPPRAQSTPPPLSPVTPAPAPTLYPPIS
ncbi:hypothetical protein JCM11641_003827, partial [Rhodosporidiobolus odoratus]